MIYPGADTTGRPVNTLSGYEIVSHSSYGNQRALLVSLSPVGIYDHLYSSAKIASQMDNLLLKFPKDVVLQCPPIVFGRVDLE